MPAQTIIIFTNYLRLSLGKNFCHFTFTVIQIKQS
jgi:hypothetical protein